jgi:hypothetical protein
MGSIAPPGSDLSVEYEERGSRFLSDATEGHSQRPAWYAESEEPAFDPLLANELLRSFGLRPPRKRLSARPELPASPHPWREFAPPPFPGEFDEYITESGEVDLTQESVREASLLDHEGEEAGEVESPFVRTDDAHMHGKPRGGHARSVRPARGKR